MSETGGARWLEYQLQIQPRTYDIDFIGHVNNIVYIRWMEDLRVSWLDKYFPLEKQQEQGFSPVLIRTEIDYLKQLKLHDKNVVGSVWMEELGRVKWQLGFEITCEGQVVARAQQVGIFYHIERGKPIRPPKEFIEILESGKPADV